MKCCDFPCCGHEPGCCPDFDECGNQLNMKCTCGATLPLNNRYSICDSCLNRSDEDICNPDEYDGFFRDDEPDELTEMEDFEQTDEYFGREDFGDFDCPFYGE